MSLSLIQRLRLEAILEDCSDQLDILGHSLTLRLSREQGPTSAKASYRFTCCSRFTGPSVYQLVFLIPWTDWINFVPLNVCTGAGQADQSEEWLVSRLDNNDNKKYRVSYHIVIVFLIFSGLYFFSSQRVQLGECVSVALGAGGESELQFCAAWSRGRRGEGEGGEHTMVGCETDKLPVWSFACSPYVCLGSLWLPPTVQKFACEVNWEHKGAVYAETGFFETAHYRKRSWKKTKPYSKKFPFTGIRWK